MIKLTNAFLIALALAPLPAAAVEHDHGHGHGPAKLQLDHGKKWPTDDALRRNMAAMAASVSAQLPALRKGTLGAGDYADLGRAVEGHVADVVAQCKLAPEADAMLHLVVADLVAAADVLQGRADGKPAAALHKTVDALNRYGRYFDHPGWRPVR